MKKISKEDILNRFKNKHGDKFDYSLFEYHGINTLSCIICPIHGEFKQSPDNHMRGRECPKCAQIQRTKSKTKSNDKFIEQAQKVHGNFYNYNKSNYLKAKSKITIICPKHGEFEMIADYHLNGKICPNCKKQKNRKHDNKIKSKEARKSAFIKKANEIHKNKFNYNYINYKNSHTKIKIKCPDHGCFEQTPFCHLNTKYACKKCIKEQPNFKKINLSDFKDRANNVHNNKYNYCNVTYNSFQDYITIICPNHGEFKQSASNHLVGKGCNKCANENRNKNKIKTFESFLSEANKAHNFKFKYIKYNGSSKHVTIRCPIHGIFKQNPNVHVKSIHGCPKCAGNGKKTKQDFIMQSENIHNNKYDYSNVIYKNKNSKVKIKCFKHGYFHQTPGSHLNGSGCPKCSNIISKGEIDWISKLQKENPNILTGKVLNVNGRIFKPDGFDPKTNTVYEYNGNYFHGNPEIYNQDDINVVNGKTFGELYKYTLEKEQYLLKHGYKVISKWGN